MTEAVCVNCGSRKFGAIVKCDKCQFTPATAMDFAWSLTHTDHYLESTQVMMAGATVRAYNIANGPPIELPKSVFEQLETLLRNPSMRDPFTLVRKAKKGFFKSEINMHLLKDEHYFPEVIRGGEEIGREEFNKLVKGGIEDLFIRRNQSNQSLEAIAKERWYVAFDEAILCERESSVSPYLKQIDRCYIDILEAIGPGFRTDRWSMDAALRQLGIIT